MDRQAALLRRYVMTRSSGQYPHPEYARRVAIDDIGFAWLRCDAAAARASERWRRVRVPGRSWCPVLGTRIEIAHDVDLQAFFLGVMDDDWVHLERQIRRRPERCLAEWRDAGHRLIAAARAAADAADAAAAGHRVPGKLSGWPAKRGSGAHSLAPERCPIPMIDHPININLDAVRASCGLVSEAKRPE